MADNTKYPYYGEMRTDTEIRSPKLPGTKLCRMFQGHSIFGAKMHLFTYFTIIKKGVYRCKDIFSEIQWLRWCGFKLSYGLVDREFYRATLIRDFKKLKSGMIIPSKKFQAVKNEMMKFLRKHRKVVDNYLFSQSNKQYPHQSSANVFLAFIGHKDKSAHDVRDEYYHSKKNIHDMVKELAGFITTIVPWKNIKSFCKFLSRTYKTRWNIETGFRCLNSTHRSFRNRDPVKQLCQMYLKAIIYNNWQFWRKRKLKECTTSSDAAQVLYLRKYSQAVVSILSDIVIDRVNYALKKKWRTIFNRKI